MFFPTKESRIEMTPTEFEKNALLVLQQQLEGIEKCKFEHNKIVSVSDGNYQIDGYIEFSAMGITYKTFVECKHYKNSIKRENVQLLYDKLRACGAHKGILISSSNFQSGAITYATQHGIALIQLTEAGSEYHTRSMLDMPSERNYSTYCDEKKYIGVMQTSIKDGLIHCYYLSDSDFCLRNFLQFNTKIIKE